MKNKLYIINLIFLLLSMVFVMPVWGVECDRSKEINKCMGEKMWTCEEDNQWHEDYLCENGCNPDMTSCASSADEAQGLTNSTYTPPENDDGSPYGTTQKSGLIPNYGLTGFKFENKSVGDIFSKLLPYIYVIAGLILLVMLIMGGLGLMTAAGNPDKMKAGYGKITNALIGFLIIFVSYFVVQLVETILGIKIL